MKGLFRLFALSLTAAILLTGIVDIVSAAERKVRLTVGSMS